jgi:diguanylate cyclase (GGDEF)-like protein
MKGYPAARPGTEVTMEIRRRAWAVTLVVGACMTGVYFLVPTQLGQDILYSVIGLASFALVLVGIRINRPPDRLAWNLVATAVLLLALGDLASDYFTDIVHRATPVPSIADLFYLLAYPFLFVGVSRLSRNPNRRAAREDYADAAIIALGVLTLSWHFLLNSYVHESGVSPAGRLVALAYPIMDVALVFVLFRSVIFGSVRRTFHLWLTAAMTMMLVGDFAFDLFVLHNNSGLGEFAYACFLIQYVLMAVAALHPSVAGADADDRAPGAVDERAEGDLPGIADQRTEARRRLPLVASAAFVPPSLLVVTALTGSAVDVTAISILCLAVLAVIGLRMLWMLTRIGGQADDLEHHARELEASHAVRDALEADLRHLAYHDELTGLANRTLLQERVALALAGLEGSGRSVALFFGDLDGFKAVNDSLGHHVGDSVLTRVAAIITANVRPGDTVARMGGDEFAVLMPDVRDEAVAVDIAQRVVRALDDSLGYEGSQSGISMSVGLAITDSGATPAELIGEADAAMYEAKAHGRNRIEVFDPAMRTRLVERMEITNGFRGALERGEFHLQYQPVLALDTMRVCGFEALARWDHPTLGPVPPSRFVPLAEETGFIVPLGRWALHEATRQLAEWSGTTARPLRMAVNLSRRQLASPQLADDVRAAIATAGIAASQLALEITENVLMDDPERATVALAELRAMGIAIAIDDFGTGYSSLGFLQRFPVDVLKIDREFIEPLNRSEPVSTALVGTIIGLATTMGLDVVAEGIERQDQLDRLVDLGCSKGQGFLMSRPLDAEDAGAYLSAQLEVLGAAHR